MFTMKTVNHNEKNNDFRFFNSLQKIWILFMLFEYELLE